MSEIKEERESMFKEAAELFLGVQQKKYRTPFIYTYIISFALIHYKLSLLLLPFGSELKYEERSKEVNDLVDSLLKNGDILWNFLWSVLAIIVYYLISAFIKWIMLVFDNWVHPILVDVTHGKVIEFSLYNEIDKKLKGTVDTLEKMTVTYNSLKSEKEILDEVHNDLQIDNAGKNAKLENTEIALKKMETQNNNNKNVRKFYEMLIQFNNEGDIKGNLKVFFGFFIKGAEFITFTKAFLQQTSYLNVVSNGLEERITTFSKMGLISNLKIQNNSCIYFVTDFGRLLPVLIDDLADATMKINSSGQVTPNQ